MIQYNKKQPGSQTGTYGTQALMEIISEGSQTVGFVPKRSVKLIAPYSDNTVSEGGRK